MHKRSVGAAALLLVVLALPWSALAAEPVGVMGGWRFRWGDPAPLADGSPGWQAPDFAKSLAPTAPDVEPPGREGRNVLWVALPVPEIAFEAPALAIGAASSGAVEAWAGAKRIYTSGEIRPDGTERAAHVGGHLVPLPREILGGSVLVRVQSSNPTLALTRGVTVGEGRELYTRAMRRSLIPVGVGVIGIAIGLAALVGWVRFRRQTALLGVGSFSAALGILNICQADMLPLVLGHSRAFYFALVFAVTTSTPALGHLVESGVARRPRRWFNLLVRIGTGASALAAVLTVLDCDVRVCMSLWAPFGFGTIIAAVFVCFSEARAGNFQARAFAFGLSAFVIAALLESAAMFGALTALAGSVSFGLLGLIASLVVVVASRFAQMLRHSERHAAVLQAREDEVRRLAAELSRGSERLAGAVVSLRETAASQNEVLQRQTAALTETQATAAQIKQTSDLASEKATAVLGAAERAEESGRSGGAALDQTLSGLEAVRTEVVEMSRRFAAVGERTREIDSVVASVKDLADQSHLLALNARIEAARAAQNGLGFTVVAREMAQLAAQSLDATAKIRLALRGVDDAVRSAVELSAGGSARVDEIVAQTRSSAERLREVAELATGTGASAREIATAVSQQNAGVTQILEAIRIVAEGFATATDATVRSERAAANVQQVASELMHATQRSTTATT